MKSPAAGPWIPVTEREPDSRTIVLGRWASGAVRVVEWVPKKYEGTQQGPTERHRASIYVAHLVGAAAIGFHEWSIEWAEIFK